MSEISGNKFFFKGHQYYRDQNEMLSELEVMQSGHHNFSPGGLRFQKKHGI